MFTKVNTLEIKGVAVLCMIFYHLFAFPTKMPIENIQPWMGTPITKAFQICVPIFLFMSGYGLQCIAMKKKITFISIGERLQKLYINFWWVAIPFITIGLIIHYYSIQPLDNLLLNLLGLKSSFNGTWWFYYLYVELLILFYFINKINVKKKGYITIMLFTLFITRYLSSLLPSNEELLILRHIKMILNYLNIFMLGIFFVKYDIFSWMSNSLKLNKTFIQPFLIIVPLLIRAYIPFMGITELFIIPLFLLGIANLCNHSNIGSRVLSFFGTHSMNLWLIHSFFISYYLKKITFITQSPLIMFITVVGCSLCCSLIIEKLKKITSVPLKSGRFKN